MFTDENNQLIITGHTDIEITIYNVHTGVSESHKISPASKDFYDYYSKLKDIDVDNIMGLLQSVPFKNIGKSREVYIMYLSRYSMIDKNFSSYIVDYLCHAVYKKLGELPGLFDQYEDLVETSFLVNRTDPDKWIKLNITKSLTDRDEFANLYCVLQGDYRKATEDEITTLKKKELDRNLRLSYEALIVKHIEYNHVKDITKFRPLTTVDACVDFWCFIYRHQMPDDLRIWIANKLYEDNNE